MFYVLIGRDGIICVTGVVRNALSAQGSTHAFLSYRPNTKKVDTLFRHPP
jgi:hypothetical protein